ncbi:Histidine kinase osmosensor, partial [Cryomyces antarcticus]
MVKVRIPIREQLGALVLVASLIGLAVISIATWITNHNFVLDIRSSRLSLTASLKAAQLASNLLLMQSAVRSASTRVPMQQSLQRYNDFGNNTQANWARSQSDLEAGLEGGNLLLQAQIFPMSGNGPAGSGSVLNATNSAVNGLVKLPYTNADGSPVFLGNQGLGFLPDLYPNLTYGSISVNDTFPGARAFFDGEELNENSILVLGPWQVNESYSLVSMTMPVINNTSAVDILGWLCIVIDARLISQVLEAQEGLGASGVALLVGPVNATNHLPPGVFYTSNGGSAPSGVEVHFVVPANNTGNRHAGHAYGTANSPFDYSRYPAVKQGLTTDEGNVDNAGSLISTHNEENKSVAVGFAMPNTDMCDWIVLVEQAHWEVWQPINHLRNVLLACIFGTAGAMLILAFPIAHYSSSPIRRLREATRRTVEPPGFLVDEVRSGSSRNQIGTGDDEEANQITRKEGFLAQISQWHRGGRLTRAETKDEVKRRQFRIPSKVKDRTHLIQDELTDLTQTYNGMSDELMMQYDKLEERVQQRTAELELAKKAAEAANESKTLFIANMSHELKTPLNGIMGMTAVCMSEDDPVEIKRSLGIIYKSGDLLLNLLTDILTFSKNQVGQQLSLYEKGFRVRDVGSQVLAIFDKQAKESGIDLRVAFEGPADANINDAGGQSDRDQY